MLKLRKFCPADADIILGWISNEREFRMWSADRFGDYPITPNDMMVHYDKCSSSGDFFPLTAIDENSNVLGHLILRYTNEEKTEVRFGFVIVDSSTRNRGVGRNMLELAKTYAADVLHASRLSLGVFENNLSARKCYKAAGFCELDKSDEVYIVFDEKWHCIEMNITLM
jgi:RimJ/RimL family protein N-acetyltransferase